MNAEPRLAPCTHCNTQNLITSCKRCGRGFVLTRAHAEGQLRTFDDGPISEVPAEFQGVCDFDAATDAALPLDQVAAAGMRQRTCPVCHTEFLSGHGFPL
jgi:hypothetical protein